MRQSVTLLLIALVVAVVSVTSSALLPFTVIASGTAGWCLGNILRGR
jgi:hypothetical protein